MEYPIITRREDGSVKTKEYELYTEHFRKDVTLIKTKNKKQ